MVDLKQSTKLVIELLVEQLLNRSENKTGNLSKKIKMGIRISSA